ncbi:MAG: oligoendopeptidase F [Candidatus Neomarinimicrobiota bacterium]|nr:MAG: oligoendopeptidase F [Candidatus Neomarinimicrobiota bacterium]
MKRLMSLITIVALLLSVAIAGEMDKSKQIPTRDEIDEQYRWNLADIYPTTDAWEKDYAYVESKIDHLKKYKGRLIKSKNLEKCLKESEELEKKLDLLYVSSHLLKDQDTKNTTSQALAGRIASMNQQFYQERAFLWPEIQEIPTKKLSQLVEQSDYLKQYEHAFDDMVRQKEHILSEREEELLSMAGQMGSEFSNIREALTQADIEFPKVKDDDGDMIELSYGRYSALLQSKDPEIRRGAFKGMYGTFDKFKNTSAATYRGSIKKDIFYAKARGYDSCIEMALDGDNVPVEVYDNLITTVHEYMEPLHRYMNLRKKIMGVDELHLYDTSVPITAESEVKYTYEEAVDIILKALEVMGPEYQANAKMALSSRWVDVYETRNKRSGAYSWGAYGVHPYILMNFNGTRNSVFTLIHELGHSLHSFYTNKNQPYPTANYSLFVAEVASTFNENLLMNYMLQTLKDKDEKLSLLDQWADNLQGTLYTQVLFAEFEREAHSLAEQGIPLTVEKLSDTYMNILKSYYEGVLEIDDEYALTWSRIPHFYRQFYVYKYATSICASTDLSKKVIDGEEGALDKYMAFLSSGSSDYPIELLKKAGVDISTPEPIASTLQLFDSIITQMEELIEE